jgi:hypothetical protein
MASDALIDDELSQRAHEALATRLWTVAYITGKDSEELGLWKGGFSGPRKFPGQDHAL